MIDQEMLDTFGVPEYFVTTVGRTEDAGGGCVRIFNCIKRGNALITLFTVVIPAVNLIVAARQVEDAAQEISLKMEKEMAGAVH